MASKAALYLVIGLPLLVFTALTDSIWFFMHLYHWNIIKVQEASKYPKISLKAFNKFYFLVN